jgi:diguanylate cyclase (GGDEF)-like protein
MDRLPDSSGPPLRRFLTAFSLYTFWCLLAAISDLRGYTSLSRAAAMPLLAGIVATNLAFLVMACIDQKRRPAPKRIALAQSLLGIVWASAYAFLSSGAGELVSGIYITTFLFATLNVGRRALVYLALISVTGYGLVILVKSLLNPLQTDIWRESIPLGIFAGVVTGLLLYGINLQKSRQQMPNVDGDGASAMDKSVHGPDHDYITKTFNQRYIIDSLAREKGWTDRTNNPFSICVFDIDRFSAISAEHGSRVSEHILNEFLQRIRGVLRAMDAVNPTGIERTIGRYSNQEYIAILPHTSLRGAERCAERARQAIEDTPFERAQSLTISTGVAEYRRGETVAELLVRAEKRLKVAIKAGGNKVCGDASKKPGNAKIIELHNLKS